MFNNDLTQNYNHQDATLEILIMLTGAFLLGCLLCWLIRKLYATNDATSLDTGNGQNYQYTGNGNSDTSRKETQSFISTNKQARIIEREETSTSSYSSPKIDDLTKISGITPRIQSLLKNNSIKSFTDLRDANKQSLVNTLNLREDSSTARDAQTWQHQASLAAKGDWNKLTEYQSFLQRTRQAKSSHDKDVYKENVRDDLKKIEGIGPKIEEILNRNNIQTYKDLRKTDRDTLKDYLSEANHRFSKHEPETWPLQSGMAERGEWEELKIYQEFMDDDSELFSESKDSDNTNNEVNLKNEPASNVSYIDKNKADSNSPNKDDLRKIDGIGPKIQNILNNNGINTYKGLRKSNRDTLKSYLDKAGDQFKIHEPETWPHQAGLAEKGEWRKLAEYQDYMHGARELSSSKKSKKEGLKAPSLHVKDISNDDSSKNKTADDLKKIEGIGPKIEELLHKAGILTFEKLKSCSSTTIKDLLDAAGPQYRMHNPDTWPHQAKMAYEGEWQKLKEYQDFLLGGRE